MKNIYLHPKIQIVQISAEDVMTVSVEDNVLTADFYDAFGFVKE